MTILNYKCGRCGRQVGRRRFIRGNVVYGSSCHSYIMSTLKERTKGGVIRKRCRDCEEEFESNEVFCNFDICCYCCHSNNFPNQVPCRR